MASAKPRVLVLGGLGFIGKHLVKHLVQSNAAEKIRVVDKIMIEMARLNAEERALFSNVEAIQANLTNADAVARSFADATGDYNIVINVAAETKLSQQDAVYNEGITRLSTLVAQEAVKHKVERFIQVSTADVYQPSSSPSNEDSSLKPWSGIGQAHLAAEEALKKIPGLPLIIVRPALVYGPGDTKSLAPRICIAAVYKKTGEKLEYPQWFETTKINSVHVDDVARGIWHLVQNGVVGKVYNLADKADLDQKKLNVIFEKLFGIKTGHLGTIKSEALKLLKTESIVDEVNGEHAPTWSKMVSEAKLEYSPLTPWLSAEALSNCSLSVNGSAVEATGFTYQVPDVTEETIRAQIQRAVNDGWFPAGLIA